MSARFVQQNRFRVGSTALDAAVALDDHAGNRSTSMAISGPVRDDMEKVATASGGDLQREPPDRIAQSVSQIEAARLSTTSATTAFASATTASSDRGRQRAARPSTMGHRPPRPSSPGMRGRQLMAATASSQPAPRRQWPAQGQRRPWGHPMGPGWPSPATLGPVTVAVRATETSGTRSAQVDGGKTVISEAPRGPLCVCLVALDNRSVDDNGQSSSNGLR